MTVERGQASVRTGIRDMGALNLSAVAGNSDRKMTGREML
jgi:hypothetical protein